ncbi:hypothetical protein TWF694_003367 [Orbilia ellipsospora]|uniref:Uncharacterized protein n=1 Tax=Orbilia ellipsospora TaxID=2528407 RepID=A0AAV9WYV2_9PEZI
MLKLKIGKIRSQNYYSLRCLLTFFGYPFSPNNLHCAGNDANFTLRLLLCLGVYSITGTLLSSDDGLLENLRRIAYAPPLSSNYGKIEIAQATPQPLGLNPNLALETNQPREQQIKSIETAQERKRKRKEQEVRYWIREVKKLMAAYREPEKHLIELQDRAF